MTSFRPIHLLIVIYLISRLFIWVFRPQAFSEIIYSYMPYAHLWASGTKPYLEQWYEYPPVTIPLFYIPHIIDRETRETPFHLNYLQSYRGLLLIVDLLLFGLIWKTLQKQKVALPIFITAVLYYIGVTTKAHHFLYDTMDLTFAASLTLAAAAPVILSAKTASFFSWLGTFLAIGLKYVNAPLIPIYALLERQNWKRLMVSGFIAFALVWALPLSLFRSSLSVSLVYHDMRGIQVDSAAAILLRTIDQFTQSERIIEIYKNYEVTGPLTDQAKSVMKLLFPASLLIYVAIACWLVLKVTHKRSQFLRIHLTLGYILLFMLTGKVLSTPFLLWHIPLLAIYPFTSLKRQLSFLVPSAIIIFVSMTQVSNDLIGIFPIPLIVGWIRTLAFGFLFIQWLCLTRDEQREAHSPVTSATDK